MGAITMTEQKTESVTHIEFKRQYSMKNGNKVTKKNWHKVYAVSSEPCTHVHGVSAIDRVIASGKPYFEKWQLVYEADDKFSKGGYIFREVNHNGGINGRHATFKGAIWHAIKHGRISVFLEP